MRKNNFYLMVAASAMLAAMTLTGCSVDDNPVVETQPTVEPIEGIDIEAYDGLAELQEALVATDSLGNFVSRNVGKPLDEADTTVVSIGVKTVEDAREMFETWLSEDTEVQEWAPNTLTATLTDEDGQKQGEVYFTPSGIPSELASVTFSDDLDIRHVSEVKFIPEQLWPNNAAAKSPYKLLEVVKKSELVPRYWLSIYFGHDKEYSNKLETKTIPKICIREATPSVKGILVWAGEECFAHYFDDKDYIHQWATLSQAKEVANILNKKKDDSQWMTYSGGEHTLKGSGDFPLVLENEYWYNGRTMYLVTYGCKTFKLKNKKTKYYDTTFWGIQDLVGYLNGYPLPPYFMPLHVEYFDAE